MKTSTDAWRSAVPGRSSSWSSPPRCDSTSAMLDKTADSWSRRDEICPSAATAFFAISLSGSVERASSLSEASGWPCDASLPHTWTAWRRIVMSWSLMRSNTASVASLSPRWATSGSTRRIASLTNLGQLASASA
eukprot:CAMPEP_0180374360 /NCGR_PEP_ID=MMETSP0989-20121125/21930_1 /TAXON_ID=697907 /ORGANISM="non described non described, Strain CCMP2293" /LENGTH=134 /DNA_ID=CAMNT_0022371683 /DNA_START=82 /DNA_END=483 /DNA_ORIENTATION=-